MTKINTDVKGLSLGTLIDGEYAGIVDNVAIGTSVSAYDILYPGTSFQYDLADASAESTMPALCIALESGSSGTILALFFGKVRHDTWNWSVGPLYVSATAGGLTQTAPGSGENVQIVGYAIDADTVFFGFYPTVITLA